MSVDTVVYEQKDGKSKIALLDNGKLCEYEQFKNNGVCEGNIYLGKITGKTELVNGRVGYFVDINDEKQIIKAIEDVDQLDGNKAIESAKNNTIEMTAKRLNELISK